MPAKAPAPSTATSTHTAADTSFCMRRELRLESNGTGMLLADTEQVNDRSQSNQLFSRMSMYALGRRGLVSVAAIFAIALIAGCHHDPPATPPAPKAMPAAPLALSALATQRIVLIPSFGLWVAPDVPAAWRTGLSRPDDELRALDSAIVSSLSARGVNRTWIFPAALDRDHRRNPNYVPDPY